MAIGQKSDQNRRLAKRVRIPKAPKAVAQSSLLSAIPFVSVNGAWLKDLFSLLFLGIGAFLLLSLGSYLYLSSRSLSAGTALSQKNLMGPTGHIVATILTGTIGAAAVLPVLGLVWLAFFRGNSRTHGDNKGEEPTQAYSFLVILLSSVIAIFACATFIAVLNSSTLSGGDLGAYISSHIKRHIGFWGALLLSLSVGIAAGAISLQRTLGDVAHGVRWVVQNIFVLFGKRAPVAVYSVSKGAGGALGRTIVSGAGSILKLGYRRGERLQVYPVIPKPRLRKEVSAPLERTQSPKGPDSTLAKYITTPEASKVERADPIIVKQKNSESFSVMPSASSRGSKVPVKVDAQESSVISDQFKDYVPPSLSLLTREEASTGEENDEELRQKAEQIEAKLRDFNIAGRVTQVHPGPVITLFEFEPAAGVKVGRIAALQDDLAMSLKASSIRIIAPIPKRGTVGIEVPNKNQAMVRLRDCLESSAAAEAESILSIPLGKDTYGDAVVVDIASMPHLLMAGATGTGKSVSINSLLLSLLYRAHPSELGLILIDPKVLELSIYDGIPHLRVPVVTDPRQAKAVLSWAVKEMDRRYRFMQKFGVRNIDGYNKIVSGEAPNEAEDTPRVLKEQIELLSSQAGELSSFAQAQPTSDESPEPIAPEQLKPMPKLVIVIDELADLMLTVGREVEELITRLAQKARAAGIHLILATQRPSVDVITGLIKANFPARLSFRVSSRIDSRTILDSMGAEKLLGKGDMLFMLPGAVPLKRIHGAFVSDSEVQKVVKALKGQCKPQYDENIIAAVDKALKEEASSDGGSGSSDGNGEDEYDQFYDKAVELVLEKGQASTSMIQRTFRIGYNRAARIIEMMEKEGVVGKMDGVKPREVLSPALQNE